MQSNIKRIYRVNPTCPCCGEEHAYFNIQISNEEQEWMDLFYKKHEDKTALAILLEGAPIIVERTFKCPVCDAVYKKKVGITRGKALDYCSSETIPMGVKEI